MYLISSMLEWCSTVKFCKPTLSSQEKARLQSFGVLCRTFPFPILEIPSEKLVDHIAIPYASKDHVHNKALHSPDISSQGDYLDYFKNFQPKNLFDIFPIGDQNSGEKLARMSPHFFANSMPWSLTERLPLASASSNISCYHFGPADEKFVKSDLSRLQKASKMLQVRGYKPFHYPDGFIRGFIVEDGKDYCFVVTSGKHRAATVVKNNKSIKVRLEWNHFLGVVSLDDAENLPQVQSGLFDVETSKSLIMYYIKEAS